MHLPRRFALNSLLIALLATSSAVALAEEAATAPVQAAVSGDSAKLRQMQADLALKKIDVFRTTVRTTTAAKGMFARLISSSVSLIDTDLLLEMNRFTERHLNLPETAEVFHLKGLVHHRTDNFHAAALDWMMLQVIYPDSSFAAEAGKRLKELSGDQLKKNAPQLKEMSAKIATLQGSRDQRIATFLQYLGTLNEEKFAAPIIAECSAFLASNETWLGEDVIEHALARQAMLIDNQIAIYHFNKLLAFYPDSPLRPDSLLSMGHVQRKGLKFYDQAAKSYARLIEQYPESSETKLGYEALANMYEEEMRDNPNALKTYDAIVAKYKDDAVVLRALRASALIYQNKTSQPAKAVESYIKISETFKGMDALDALNKASKIATNSLRDWKMAMEINDRIIALVPNTDDAAKALYANAELLENKLNDKEQAKKVYNDFLTRHPDHGLAKDAAKRLAALNPPPAAAAPAAPAADAPAAQ